MQRNLIAFTSLLSLAAACADRDRDADVDSAEQTIDSTESLEAEGNLMMGALEGAEVSGLTALTADDAATRIAANIRARWSRAP